MRVRVFGVFRGSPHPACGQPKPGLPFIAWPFVKFVSGLRALASWWFYLLGCSPHCSLCCPAYAHSMTHHTVSQVQKQKNADDRKPTVAADLNQNETEPAPSPGEVASRAYFSYVNQGSQHGHDVRHWLEAETQLLADRLNASPQPPKRVRPIAKSRDIRTEAASSSEDHGAGGMKTGQDPQSLFHICALL